MATKKKKGEDPIVFLRKNVYPELYESLVDVRKKSYF
jgi:hypothetical protein